MMRRWWKILGGFALLLLVAWLAVARPPEHRFTALGRLVAAGTLGSASAQDLDVFQQLVQQAVSAAAVSGSVVINGQPMHGALHFYLTDMGAKDFTRCSTGNAVYD